MRWNCPARKGLMDIRFIDPVPAVLEEIKNVTGKGIDFIPKENLSTYAALRMARKDMPSHLIYYKKEHDEIINHLVVHECGHLFRIFKCPENQRLIPYSDKQIKYNALKQIENEIIALRPVLSEDQIAHVINLWYDGLIRQVTNLPPDIMIEKWIHDEFPALRSLQLKSIKKQHSESVAGLTETVRRMTPTTILFASNVMNYAFFRILGLHVGQNFVREYSSTHYIGKGKELASITERNYTDSHEGDNMMIDKWAAFVNISDWFKWRGFEDVPLDYGQTE
ncbi:MAG: hypothetical protein ABIH34_06005 [Nanoarchaeota archaeon]